MMKKVVLLIGDIILLYISLAITLFLRYHYLDQALWARHLWPFSIIFAIWLIVFFINGLYEIYKAGNSFKFYGKLVQNLLINALLAVLFFYLILGNFTTLKPQKVLIVLLVIFTILFLLWRKLFFSIISSSTLRNNLAIVGINNESLMLCEEIIKKPHLGYELKLIINPDHITVPQNFQMIPISKDITNLKKELINYKINTLVTVNDPKYSPEIARYLFESIDLKIRYFNLTSFYEKLIGKIPISSLERNWFLENITQKNNEWFIVIKRIIDIVFAGLLGIVSLILLPFIYLLIKLDSKGPLIYKQSRIGLAGKEFMVYKLRSMVHNAEKDGAVWAQQGDARITKIGKFMRKSRIDEMPQFWNILKGDMSFVGPRPERPEFVKELKEAIPFYNERHLVKPGLTGWAQINFPYGASVADAKEKLSYDMFYIKNQSVALDISIILKTINAIFNITLGR